MGVVEMNYPIIIPKTSNYSTSFFTLKYVLWLFPGQWETACSWWHDGWSARSQKGRHLENGELCFCCIIWVAFGLLKKREIPLANISNLNDKRKSENCRIALYLDRLHKRPQTELKRGHKILVPAYDLPINTCPYHSGILKEYNLVLLLQ